MVDQTGSFGYDRDFSGLYDAVTGLIKDYLKTHEDRGSKVIEFHPPSQLRELVDVSVPEEGVEETVVVELVKTILKYSVHTGNKLGGAMAEFEALNAIFRPLGPLSSFFYARRY